MVVSNALFLIGPTIHSPPISERANRLRESRAFKSPDFNIPNRHQARLLQFSLRRYSHGEATYG